MIYDHLSNIDRFKGLSSDIYEGLCFVKHASLDMANGIYEINPRVKAIVSVYETKTVNEYGYETHEKYIDIHCALKGQERVACLPIDKLTETKPYSEEKDAAFYSSSVSPQEMTIGDGYFAIIFPQEGHMPQLSVAETQMVKKIVIKVEMEKTHN